MNSQHIHLAIIPDGNRRWAKGRLLKPWEGHRHGMDNSRALIEWCRQNPRISVLTIWGFSTENWKRPDDEVAWLMRIYEDYLSRERDTFIKNKTRLIHSGRKDRLPASLVKLMENISAETSHGYEFTLNFAIDYGGRDEILRAVDKLRGVEKDAEVTEELMRQYFDNPDLPDIDLVIRTSGEQRTSGFFIWQAAYAEWHFEQKYFPDLMPEDLEKAVKNFDSRQRRLGK